MNDFLARVAALPEEKRHLLNLLLKSEPIARPALEEPFVAPRDERERALAGIWAEVLGLAEVGIHDHFLELGGDSILAIQVIAKGREAGLRISSTQLFATPTIAGLAAALAEEGPDTVTAEATEAATDPVLAATPAESREP